MNKIQGQSTTEYVLVLFCLVLALFVGNPSAVEMLLDGFRAAYANFTFPLSLPAGV